MNPFCMLILMRSLIRPAQPLKSRGCTTVPVKAWQACDNVAYADATRGACRQAQLDVWAAQAVRQAELDLFRSRCLMSKLHSGTG